jgi:hypothetical protein
MSTFTEDEVQRSRREPASMDFQAPLHTPYGTGERTELDFWGRDADPLLNRRPLLPDYVLMEHEWDRNPHECGIRKSFVVPQVYETKDSKYADFSTGALSVRSNDIKQTGLNTYASFVQSTNREFLGADPIIGNGAGGMGPVMGPYLGKKGTQQKPETCPDYVGPAGGAMASAGPPQPMYTLPSATRRNRSYPQGGHGITGGYVSDFGGETVNPREGGRGSLFGPGYEAWTFADGGFVASGADLTINDPNSGARYKLTSELRGANDPIMAGMGGIGSSLELNPQTGGRPSRLLDFDTVIAGGSRIGTRGTDANNPIAGGRPSQLLNFTKIIGGGATTGVASSLSENPQVGGRPSRLINFSTSTPGGISSGVFSGSCNDVTGGMPLTKTEGTVGYVSPAGFGAQYYGGDIAFGLQRVGPRIHRTETESITIPGASGRGSLNDAGLFGSLANTIINEKYNWDDTPDPTLQNCARNTLGSRALLNFSQINLDDLMLTTPC